MSSTNLGEKPNEKEILDACGQDVDRKRCAHFGTLPEKASNEHVPRCTKLAAESFCFCSQLHKGSYAKLGTSPRSHRANHTTRCNVRHNRNYDRYSNVPVDGDDGTKLIITKFAAGRTECSAALFI